MSREQEIGTKEFLERFGPYILKMLIKRRIFYDFDKIEIRLLFADLSQHFGIYLMIFAGRFFIHRHDGVRGDLRSFVS